METIFSYVRDSLFRHFELKDPNIAYSILVSRLKDCEIAWSSLPEERQTDIYATVHAWYWNLQNAVLVNGNLDYYTITYYIDEVLEKYKNIPPQELANIKAVLDAINKCVDTLFKLRLKELKQQAVGLYCWFAFTMFCMHILPLLPPLTAEVELPVVPGATVKTTFPGPKRWPRVVPIVPKGPVVLPPPGPRDRQTREQFEETLRARIRQFLDILRKRSK